MTTDILVRQCVQDYSILLFMAQMAENAAKTLPVAPIISESLEMGTFNQKRKTASSHSVVFAFFANIALKVFEEIFKKKKRSQVDSFLLKVFPTVLKGLKYAILRNNEEKNEEISLDNNNISEWHVSCCMVLSYILSKIKLERERIDYLLFALLPLNKKLSETTENSEEYLFVLNQDLLEKVLLTTDHVCNSQQLQQIPKNVLDSIIWLEFDCNLDNFDFNSIIGMLNQLNLNFNIRLPMIIARQLLKRMIEYGREFANKKEKESDDIEMNESISKDNSITFSKYSQFLIKLLKNYSFDFDSKLAICEEIVDLMLAFQMKHKKSNKNDNNLEYTYLKDYLQVTIDTFNVALDEILIKKIMFVSHTIKSIETQMKTTPVTDNKTHKILKNQLNRVHSKRNVLFNLMTAIRHDVCSKILFVCFIFSFSFCFCFSFLKCKDDCFAQGYSKVLYVLCVCALI